MWRAMRPERWAVGRKCSRVSQSGARIGHHRLSSTYSLPTMTNINIPSSSHPPHRRHTWHLGGETRRPPLPEEVSAQQVILVWRTRWRMKTGQTDLLPVWPSCWRQGVINWEEGDEQVCRRRIIGVWHHKVAKSWPWRCGHKTISFVADSLAYIVTCPPSVPIAYLLPISTSFSHTIQLLAYINKTLRFFTRWSPLSTWQKKQ